MLLSMRERTRELALACLTLLVAACGGGDSGGSTRSAPAYSLGGTVSGLDEGYVELRNGLDVQRVTANPNGLALDERYTFNTPLPAGAGYSVQIANDPLTEFGLQCELQDEQGTMPAREVRNVVIRCARVRSVRFLAGSMSPDPGKDGLASQISLTLLDWISFDPSGNLYLSDNQTVRRVTPTGVVTTLGSAQLPFAPAGLAADSSGTVYTTQQNAIYRTRPNGTTTLYAGVEVEPGTTDGPVGSARFFRPTRLAVNRAGDLLVLDISTSPMSLPTTVRRISVAGIVSTIGPVPGRAPGSMALDSSDNIFVCQADADTNATSVTVFRVTSSAATVQFSSIPSGSAAPCVDMKIDAAGNFYISDGDTVRRVTPAGQSTVLQGISQARGLALDASGTLFAVSRLTTTVLRAPTGTSPTHYVGVPHAAASNTGEAGSADGSGADARFNSPQGLAADAAGNVYVADRGNHVIRRITPAGVVSTFAGAADHQPGHTDGAASSARFREPTGVAVDAQGRVFVAEMGNRTVRMITPAGQVSTLAGSSTDPAAAVDASGTAARFVAPRRIAVAPSGDLYVTDDTRIRRIAATTLAVTTPNTGVTASVTVTPAGTDYYVDTNGIYRIGDNFLRGATDATLGTPTDLAAGPDSELYVAYGGTGMIVKHVYTTTPNIPFQVSAAVGVRTLSGMELGPLPARIGHPVGLAVTQKRVYFSTDNAILFIDR